jgi:hypothetical protein
MLIVLLSMASQRFVWPIALGSLYVSPAFGAFSGVAVLCHTSAQGLRLNWPVKIEIWASG